MRLTVEVDNTGAISLYEKMARSPGGVDLSLLWSRLGIEDAGSLRFRDDAPLASIRRAITPGP